MTEPHRHINPWLITAAVMFATFMEVLDTTVVNVSLPHIAGNLSSTIDEATWVLTSYLVANAIILPMTGWLASMFGRKRLLMLSVVGFTAASFLCGLAPTLGTLIFFRVLQGATGGALQPLSQAVLLEAFAPQDRGKAMGVWALGIVVAPILGPVLGGWLTDNYSWRWVFYINIPVGIASIVMTKLYIFDPAYLRAQSRKVDYWGIGMLAVGIGALQIVLDKGQEEDWFSSPLITMLAVISAVTIVALIAHELTTEDPVVDLRVFKARTYAVGVFLMTVVGFVLYGSMVLLPIMLQTLLGYPPMQAGIAMAPRGIGAFLMMPLTGQMTGRFDARKLLSCGLLVGGRDAALAVAPEPAGRLLGRLLAPAHAGRRHVAALRAADDGLDGSDSARAHGQRDEPVQPDAEHRRQRRHRRHRHDARPQQPVDDVHARVARHHLRPGQPVDVHADARRVHGIGCGRHDGREPRHRRDVRHGAASGDDGVLRRNLPAPRHPVHCDDPARADHEAAEARRPGRRCTLTRAQGSGLSPALSHGRAFALSP